MTAFRLYTHSHDYECCGEYMPEESYPVVAPDTQTAVEGVEHILVAPERACYELVTPSGRVIDAHCTDTDAGSEDYR